MELYIKRLETEYGVPQAEWPKTQNKRYLRFGSYISCEQPMCHVEEEDNTLRMHGLRKASCPATVV